MKAGTVRMVEFGSTVTSEDAVYIGHALAAQEIMTTFAEQIVKRVFSRLGTQITHMSQKIQSESAVATTSVGIWHISYRNQLNGPLLFSQFLIPAEENYGDVANELRDRLYNLSNVVTTLNLYEMWLEPTAGNNAQHVGYAARIHLQNMSISWDCSSKMEIQNRTLANSGGSGENNRNDVANNPVGGKLYSGTGNGTSLSYYNTLVALTELDLLTADTDSGVLDFDVNGTNVTTGMKLAYKRPPPHSMFTNVRKSAAVSIQPGQIKTSFLRWTRTLTVNNFLKLMFEYMTNRGGGGAGHVRVSIGSFNLYGFEKRCDTGGTETGVNIGYEVNSVYKCSLTSKFVATGPTIVVHTV